MCRTSVIDLQRENLSTSMASRTAKTGYTGIAGENRDNRFKTRIVEVHTLSVTAARGMVGQK